MERSSINHFINGQYVYKTFRNTYLFRLSCKKGDLKKVNFKYIDKYRFGFMGYNKKDTVAMVKVASTSVLKYEFLFLPHIFSFSSYSINFTKYSYPFL